MTVDISIAVLSGGKSSRMGQNKALLSLNGKTLIEHVLTTADSLTPTETFIITNTPPDYDNLPYRKVGDTHHGHGAISGIISALHHSATDYVLVIACDMPFVKTELLQHLIGHTHSSHYQAIVPMVDKYPQGVLAIYHKQCLPTFIGAIASDQRKLKHIIESLDNVCFVGDWQQSDPQGLSFININTPADLETAQTHKRTQ